MKPDFSANRFEIKYVMHAAKAEQLRQSLRDILVADDHTSSVSKGYFNHSIYFDSYSLQRYLEKHEGQDRRIKIRLRSYREFQDGTPAGHYLELKHRLGGIVKKDRLELTPEQADHILRSELSLPDGLDMTSPVMQAYLYHSKVSLLRPIVSLQYHRAAYHTKIYPGVRITFDRKFCASRSHQLPTAGTSTPTNPALHPAFMVVELKYNNQVPRMLVDRFRQHDLRQVTFSKYATAMETIYQNRQNG